jgi:hypothetical protein
MVIGLRARDDPGMLKRVAAASLWFLVTWVGYEIAWSVAGVPRMIGPVLAAGIAMIVAVDPLRIFWPVQTPSQSNRSVRSAAAFDSSMPASR